MSDCSDRGDDDAVDDATEEDRDRIIEPAAQMIGDRRAHIRARRDDPAHKPRSEWKIRLQGQAPPQSSLGKHNRGRGEFAQAAPSQQSVKRPSPMRPLRMHPSQSGNPSGAFPKAPRRRATVSLMASGNCWVRDETHCLAARHAIPRKTDVQTMSCRASRDIDFILQSPLRCLPAATEPEFCSRPNSVQRCCAVSMRHESALLFRSPSPAVRLYF